MWILVDGYLTICVDGYVTCGLLPRCGWLPDLKKPFDVDIEVDVVGHLALGNH